MTLVNFLNSSVVRGAIIMCIMVIVSVKSYAQTIDVRGAFVGDSIKIGETIPFYLAAHYSDSLNVLFPDSTVKFSTFEFTRKEYFPTRTENGVSVDSAVYYLSTFEVDRIQTLGLPVYIVQPQDCTVFNSAVDSVLISQMVTEMPDSISIDKLPLKMNTAYHAVPFQFNYWIVIIAVAALAIIGIIVWLFFGKRIARYYRAKRLKRKHNEFVKSYEEIVQQLGTRFSANSAENALSFWKKYMDMERLERYPFTKLTTRETLMLTKDESLATNLRQIDRAIYSDQPTALTPFQQLRAFADQRFNKKLQEVEHG
jgi:hypothetical protein